MPLPSRGPRGYPDYQHVENWDGPLIINSELVNLKKPKEEHTTAIFEVSRYASLALTVERKTFGLRWFIEYFYDAEGTKPAGTRQYALKVWNEKVSYFRISNLGPFFRIRYLTEEPSAEAVFTVSGTNRVSTQEIIPVSPFLKGFSRVYKANETFQEVVPPLASGQARLQTFRSAGGPASFPVEVWLTEFSIDDWHFTLQTNESPTIESVEFWLPPMPIAVTVNNGAKEQTVAWELTIAT